MRRHVYYYTLLPVAFSTARAVLEGDAAGWLPAPATPAGTDWEVCLRAEGALPASIDGLSALVDVGPTLLREGKLLRPVGWRAATAERLFPRLEADLVLDVLEGHGCHLSLMGTYRPPLAVVGGAGDALYGHRVAEACVRRFVLDVAEHVTARVAEAAEGR